MDEYCKGEQMRRALQVVVLVLLAACSSPAGVDSGDQTARLSVSNTRGIRWNAVVESVDTVRPALRVTVTGRNTERSSRELYYGACNVIVKLFRTTSDTEPVWDSSRQPVVCILPLYVRRLDEGDTLSFVWRRDSRDIVSDSVAAGQYFVTAQAHFSWNSSLTARENTGELTAGYVTLKK